MVWCLHSNKYIINKGSYPLGKTIWKKCIEIYIRKINQIYKACFPHTLAHTVHLVNYVWSYGGNGIEWQFCAPELFHWNDQNDEGTHFEHQFELRVVTACLSNF